MKKVIAVIITVSVLAVCLASCSVSAAVKDVVNKIDAIGEVSVEKADVIAEASEAYEALSEKDKAKVSNLDTLTAAENAYGKLYYEAHADEFITLVDTVLSEYGTSAEDIDTLFAELERIYNNADEEAKKELKKFTEIKEKKDTYDAAEAAAGAAAVSYVKGFLEVNKDKDIEITDMGVITQLADGTMYHLCALEYTEDGEEKAVYATARFADTPSVESMLRYADKFYSEAASSDTTNALMSANVTIDLEQVISEANA